MPTYFHLYDVIKVVYKKYSVGMCPHVCVSVCVSILCVCVCVHACVWLCVLVCVCVCAHVRQQTTLVHSCGDGNCF